MHQETDNEDLFHVKKRKQAKTGLRKIHNGVEKFVTIEGLQFRPRLCLYLRSYLSLSFEN